MSSNLDSKPPPPNDDEEVSVGAPPAPQNRTVMEFETKRSLRAALESCSRRGSCCSSLGGGEGGSQASEGTLLDNADWVTRNYDEDTFLPQSAEEEADRLEVLKSYHILDAAREASFERITALASRFFDTPIALVSLVDLGRQWFMSNRGLPHDVRETHRSMAFCAHAIQSTQDLLVVPDARVDKRFVNNPLVTGPPFIRFYAGAPLICPEGYKLGTLCVIDSEPFLPEGLDLAQKQTLRELAAFVVEAMVRRRDDLLQLQEDKERIMACAAQDLRAPLDAAKRSLSLLLAAENEKGKNDKYGTENSVAAWGDKKDKDDSNPAASRNFLQSANSCLALMGRICDETVRSFRPDLLRHSGPHSSVSIADNVNEEGSSPKDDKLSTSAPSWKPFRETGAEPTPTQSTVSVSDLAQTLRDVIEPCATENVPVTISVDPTVPKEIVCEEVKLLRCALNLLTNAVRHTTEGSIRLRIFVKEMDGINDSGETHASLVFECEDSGHRLETDVQAGLFSPHRRTKPGSDGDEKDNDSMASGMGLFSVAINISNLGGQYGYYSREAWDANDEPLGGVFWFSVPLTVPYSSPRSLKEEDFGDDRKPSAMTAQSPAAGMDSSCNSPKQGQKQHKMLSLAQLKDNNHDEIYDAISQAMNGELADTPSAPVAPSVGPPKRALIIDDSIVVCKSISRALTNLGFEVQVATDGMEGLQMLQSSKYDLVFCDFLMPILDGTECVERYRQWEEGHRPGFRQRILGLSAHASEEDVRRGRAAGMDDFANKSKTVRDILNQALKICELDELPPSSESERGNGRGGAAVAAGSVADLPLSRLAMHPEFSSAGRRRLRSSFPGASLPPAGRVPRPPAFPHLARGGVVSSKLTGTSPIFPFAGTPGLGTTPRVVRDDGPPPLKCLIAEDSMSAQKVLVRAVESVGWEAVVADDGEHTLRLLKAHRWSAVLISQDLPDMVGTLCIERFREWESAHRRVRQGCIFFIAATTTGDGRGAIDLHNMPSIDGAILHKPVQLEEIVSLLQRAAQRRGDREEVQRR